MIKRLIIAIFIALIVIGGLWYLLYFNGVSTFSGLFDKLLGEGEGEIRNYSVVVGFRENEIGFNPELNFKKSLPEDLLDFLESYFTEYNNALGTLSGQLNDDPQKAFSRFYERYSDSMDYDLQLLERQVNTRLKSGIDLTFDSCDIALRLVSAGLGREDFIEVRAEESFSVEFNGIPNQKCGYSGVEHFFLLDKRSGEWLIKKHEVTSALSLYITSSIVYAESPEFKKPEDPQDSENPENDYNYEAKSALEYAARFTALERIVRNPVFAEYERNGTNFVSQCLNAGGIPEDTYWYPGSKAWTNAQIFCEYVTSPVSPVRAEVCGYSEGDIGDVVQLVEVGGVAVQSGLITGIVYNDDLSFEYLVTMNSEDFISFPVFAIGFENIRIIKLN